MQTLGSRETSTSHLLTVLRAVLMMMAAVHAETSEITVVELLRVWSRSLIISRAWDSTLFGLRLLLTVSTVRVAGKKVTDQGDRY